VNTIGIIVLAAIVLIFVIPPFIDGSVNIPNSLNPRDLGYFFGSWFNYWISVAKGVLNGCGLEC
jgi:hypothetical protein